MSNRNFAQELDNSEDDLHSAVFNLPDIPVRKPRVVEVVPDGAIVPAERGWIYRQFELTPVGVVISEATNEDDWADLGGALFNLGSAMQWLIGDWLAFGERRWGKTYEGIAAATGYEVKTLYNYVYVAKSVEFSLRKETLTFGHHNLVAGLAPHEQDAWLEKAEVGKWSISQMRREMRGDPPAPPTPGELLLGHIQASNAHALKLIAQTMNDPTARGEAAKMINEQVQFLQHLLANLGG